ncbi:MAG TPA: trimethylamine methyltransferase family protein [Phycisphaerae bacterium]|nr:trimethylamine methyltransferase family protein [Phycisphaerae bacterium]
MKTPLEPVRFLTTNEMETVHDSALAILSEVGMRIDHDEALDCLAEAGCEVNRDARVAKFPRKVVQGWVDRMRREFAERVEPEGMAVRYSQVRFRAEPLRVHRDFTVNAGGYNAFIYDLDGVRRRPVLEDTRAALRLVAQLDQITYSGIPCAAADVPLPLRPVTMVAELVKHTDKLGGIEALTPADVEWICRIGEVVRGSSTELKRRPILVGYAEARTPLCFDRNMVEVYLAYLKRGLPQSLDTMPNCGATAPMHPAGGLAVGVAETLGGLVLAKAVDAEAVVTVDVTPSFCDMQSGIFRYAGAERVPLLAARIQMISEYYGCPSGVHGGKTDSLAPDIRAGVEKGISMLAPVLCGAIGIGTVGHIENAVTFSPVQLVIDNEIARYVRRAVTGFEVTPETVDLDLIRRVGIGGNYIEQPETADLFRDLLNLSPFFAVHPWPVDAADIEARKMLTLAEQNARELMANEVESPLSDDQVREVDKIVADARLTIVE